MVGLRLEDPGGSEPRPLAALPVPGRWSGRWQQRAAPVRQWRWLVAAAAAAGLLSGVAIPDPRCRQTDARGVA